MAISNLNLNVTANTARALADFNKFSRSLDNKFLISGLKLDVVRNALSQINRDFQRAIGEQGLASATSLRAAQNQAALLTQTFKNFSSESAKAITRDIGTALNKVAVTAGGTMKDIQKSLSASSFISTALPESVRKQMTVDIMKFNRDLRRAGMGDNFGGIAQQFLTGQASGQQLMQTGGAVESFLGKEIIRRTGGSGMAYSAEQRSRILGDILSDPEIQKQLQEMAKNASGFRIILEDLNTKLFNTESGVFGALRKVIDKTGKSTTMFDEVYKIVDQVFGPNGMFRAIFNSIREVFKIGDPMRPFIDAIQFFTGVFKQLTDYFNSSGFKDILAVVKDGFDRVKSIFTSIFDQIKTGLYDSDDATYGIKEIGEGIRTYIESVGKSIRDSDKEDKVIGFITNITTTLATEIGKTTIVLIKELLMTLVSKVPEIVTTVLPALNDGINSLLTEAFGEIGGKIAKFVLGFIPGIGPIARASAVGDVTGGGGNIFSMLAMGAGALLGPGALFGGAKFLRGVSTQRGKFGMLNMLGDKAYNLETRLNRSFFLEDQLTGANRFSPLSRRLIDPLSQLIRPSTPFASINPNFYPSSINPNYFPSSINPLYGPSSILPPRSPWHQRLKLPGYQVGGLYSELGRITPESSMFNPLYGGYMTPQEKFMMGEAARRKSLISRSMIDVPERIGGRFSLLGRITAGSSMFTPRTSGGFISPRGIGTTQYTGSGIGPQPHGYEWAYRPEYSGISMGGEYAPLMESSLITPRKRISRSMGIRRGRMRRLGKYSLIGGSMLAAGSLGLGLLGGPGANAQTLGGMDAAGSVLGGGFEGAMMGATIGSIIPGIGTAAGAIIGGVIGGVAPLLDKGVREGVGKFASGLGNSMRTMGSELLKSIGEFFNGILNPLRSLPSMISGIMKWIYNSIPAPIRSTISGAGNLWSGFTSWVSNIRIPGNFYNGKDYYGPAMALESRMSGRRPMVVNDGEFVIPKDGFATLSGLVSDNIRTTGVQKQSDNYSTQVNMSLTLHVNSVVADPNELARVLKEPVYKIMGDAWMEAKNSVMTNRARVN